MRDCVAVGFSLADIRSAGYSADEAGDAFPGLFTYEELTQAGYLRTESKISSNISGKDTLRK